MRPSGGTGADRRLAPIDILFLCTGNVCRSPMAEALLRHRLQAAGIDATVHSAGLLDGGYRASDDGVAVMAARGIDTSEHLSRAMTADMIGGADLVLAMAREHVREAVLLVPEAWPRIFTLKEFVRRAELYGPRAPDQTLDEWLAKLHAGRSRGDLLGASDDDDVADPIGQRRAAYERTAGELDDLVRRAADLLWSTP